MSINDKQIVLTGQVQLQLPQLLGQTEAATVEQPLGETIFRAEQISFIQR